MVDLPNLSEMESADTTTVLRLYNDKLTELLHSDEGMTNREAMEFIATTHLMAAIAAISHGTNLKQLLMGQWKLHEAAKEAQV